MDFHVLTQEKNQNTVNIMAEILIQAKDHWMDAIPQKIRDKWTVGQWEKYGRRNIKGSPIVARSDGWKWGKKECLPEYIIVKIPGLKIEEAKKFEEPSYATLIVLPDGTSPILYRRKYQFGIIDMDNFLASQKSSVILTSNTLKTKLVARV